MKKTPTEEPLRAAVRVMHRLRAFGHQALLAGGCVRDRLMGRIPKDYDIATSARPMNVQSLFERTESVGAAFGVMLVIEGGQALEVATFRMDGPYSDGRHPDTIAFTSAREDALRRDFTVNALFWDPDEDRIDDYVGGLEDLENKIIRCVGDPKRRFEEDKLRVLRAVRFAAELDFEIDMETWQQVKAFAPQISQIAAERVREELGKLLTGRDPRRGVELLRDSGLMDALLPELKPMIGCRQPEAFHPEGDVWEHSLQVLEYLKKGVPGRQGKAPAATARLMWAGLLHDIGKPPTYSQEPGDRIRFNNHEVVGAEMAEKICKRFRMSSSDTDYIVTMVADHLRLNPAKKMKEAKLKRLLRRDDIEDLLALHWADCMASHQGMELYDFAREKQAQFAAGGSAPLRPAPLATGHDLIEMGLKPGPAFKELLSQLEDEQLEGRISDRGQALQWLRDHAAVMTVTAE